MHEFFRLFGNPIFLVFAVAFVAILANAAVRVHRINHGLPEEDECAKPRKGKAAAPTQDLKEMQELHRGFEQMSKRLEALETIIIESARKR